MSFSEFPHRKQKIAALIVFFDKIFKPFPHFPLELMEVILSLLPTIVLALGILNTSIGSAIVITQGRYIQTAAATSFVVDPMYVSLTGMLAIANGILMVFSYPDLTAKKKKGWITLLSIFLITIIQAVLAFIFHESGIVSTWIYALLALYFVFELKPYFNK